MSHELVVHTSDRHAAWPGAAQRFVAGLDRHAQQPWALGEDVVHEVFAKLEVRHHSLQLRAGRMAYHHLLVGRGASEGAVLRVLRGHALLLVHRAEELHLFGPPGLALVVLRRDAEHVLEEPRVTRSIESYERRATPRGDLDQWWAIRYEGNDQWQQGASLVVHLGVGGQALVLCQPDALGIVCTPSLPVLQRTWLGEPTALEVRVPPIRP